jgi:hypothetical protein
VLCAVLAFTAWRTRAPSAPIWARIAIVCAVFAVLRYFDTQMAVSGAVRDFSMTSTGHADWKRPGPFLMLIAIAVLGAAAVGLLLFQGRRLDPSVKGAAIAIVLLILLAIAHSLALYFVADVLQAPVGPLTVSRIIEILLLLALALFAVSFIRTAKSR